MISLNQDHSSTDYLCIGYRT